MPILCNHEILTPNISMVYLWYCSYYHLLTPDINTSLIWLSRFKAWTCRTCSHISNPIMLTWVIATCMSKGWLGEWQKDKNERVPCTRISIHVWFPVSLEYNYQLHRGIIKYEVILKIWAELLWNHPTVCKLQQTIYFLTFFKFGELWLDYWFPNKLCLILNNIFSGDTN